jgi:Zn-dependent peptidase ImmA (M78 family)
VLDTRRPTSKAEKRLFGQTKITRSTDVTDIFLNVRQSREQMFDTIIHELMHFVCGITRFTPALRHKTEEARVRLATEAAKNALLNRKNER